MKILNIAAGKFDPLSFDDDNALIPRYILNVDTSYFTNTTADVIESDMRVWHNDPDRITKRRNLNMDVFEFMERTAFMFERATLYRFLEHVSFTQIEYFIYLVSTVLKQGCLVDVIVPNYIHLAELIMNDNPSRSDFAERNILLTTELLNEPSCPHASIWTPARIKHFWELEGRFKVLKTWPVFKFDGRDIYLRSKIERI